MIVWARRILPRVMKGYYLVCDTLIDSRGEGGHLYMSSVEQRVSNHTLP